MTKLNVEAFKKEGFSYEEIESIKEGLDDVKNWRVYTEEEFYSKVWEKIFSNKKEINV